MLDSFRLWAAGAALAVVAITVGGLTFVNAQTKNELKDVRADRGAIITAADKICIALGEKFQVPERQDWGKNCLAQAVILKAFHTKTLTASNTALVTNEKVQLEKAQADLARAQRDKRLAYAALDALTEEAARVPASNQIRPEYYRRLNDVAGLRDASGAAPAGRTGAGGGGDQGEAPH